MKTLICILLFTPIVLLPQPTPQRITNPALDSHRNLGEISLGDTYEKWKDFLFGEEVLDKQLSSYTFRSDHCCHTLFENPVGLIRVTFQDDKVVSIRMELKNFLEGKKMKSSAELRVASESALNKYEQIKQQFSALLGNPGSTRSNEYEIPNEAKSVAQWRGTDTILETRYYYFKAVYPATRIVGSPVGLTEKLVEASDKTVIILSDLNFVKDKVMSGF